MATYKVRDPQGNIREISGPDGASDADVIAQAKRLFSEKPAPLQQIDVNGPQGATGTFMQNVGAGAGKAIYDTGRGLGQLARMALPERAANAIGLPTQQEIDEAARLDKPLMETGGGLVGNIGTNIGIALAPGAAMSRGSGAVAKVGQMMNAAPATLGGAVTGAGMGAALAGIQPVTSEGSRAQNMAIGGGLGAAVPLAAMGMGARTAAQQAKGLAEQLKNAPVDDVLAAARQVGYTVPPSQANAGMVGRALESMAGKAGVAQKASLKNQEVTNRLAKEALNLADDAPITEQVLQALRKDAGKAYEAIKKYPQRLPTDTQFMDDIASLGQDFAAAAKEFPEIAKNDAIEALQKALQKQDVDPRAAVELIKKLRFDASKNFKSFDDPAKAALAVAQKGAANALDDLIERTVPAAQSDAYRAARQLIAKSHDVEAALNETTGNVSTKILAKALERGKPLTGELETAAKFGRTFPKAAQNVEGISGTIGGSPLDWAIGAGSSVATGNPVMLAMALARPTARAALLSKPYQNAIMGAQNYGPSQAAQLANALMQNPRIRGAAVPAMIGAAPAALNLSQ